jgi:hypothetical protein
MNPQPSQRRGDSIAQGNPMHTSSPFIKKSVESDKLFTVRDREDD